jgi:hypothetical protein
MEGLAYLRDHSWGTMSGRTMWSSYVNRSDQFPVDLRLYYQFNRKYEQQVLNEIGPSCQGQPGELSQYLASLVSYHYRQQLYRSRRCWRRSWSSKR